MVVEEDELLAAEAEFRAKKREAEDEAWNLAQPDSTIVTDGSRSNPHVHDNNNNNNNNNGDEMKTSGGDSQQGQGGGDDNGGGGGARKRIRISDAEKKRGNRMFGALMGTLNKFKDETSKSKQTDAAKRRAELEERLQNKLRAESEALYKKRDLEVEEKNLLHSVLRKMDELGYLQQTISSRHSSKLNLANFLCTHSIQVESELDSFQLYNSIIPTLPHSLPVGSHGPENEKALYWLPRQLLPEQQVTIERQRSQVLEAIENQKSLWETEKETRQKRLDAEQALRDDRIAQIKADREATQPRLRRGSPDVQRPEVEEEEPLMMIDENGPTSAARPDMEGDGDASVGVDDGKENRGDEDAVEY